jgi:hypothetical protein
VLVQAMTQAIITTYKIISVLHAQIQPNTLILTVSTVSQLVHHQFQSIMFSCA